MNWNKNKSIVLTQVGTVCFALVVLALDIAAYWVSQWFVAHRLYNAYEGVLMMVSIYSCSVFGWIFLWQLWTLLRSIKRGEVFTPANIRRLRAASWCCFFTAAICFASGFYYLPFFIVSGAAGFTGLFIRVMKNVFAQARDMKNELDLTV